MIQEPEQSGSFSLFTLRLMKKAIDNKTVILPT
jgi:hypothetical protein